MSRELAIEAIVTYESAKDSASVLNLVRRTNKRNNTSYRFCIAGGMADLVLVDDRDDSVNIETYFTADVEPVTAIIDDFMQAKRDSIDYVLDLYELDSSRNPVIVSALRGFFNE